MPSIDVRLVEVVKKFGDVVAVDHTDLEVQDGEFFSLLGPSGCGKTTTLRMIGGFEAPTSGLIELQVPRHLEEAAMDLGANPWTTFWKVTFPLILPGVLAGALLAFSLSIDDFIIANFTSGTATKFPIWVWASIKNNLPPQVHVIGTVVFVGGVGLVAFSTVWERRSERRDRRIAAQEAAREVNEGLAAAAA